MKYVFNFFVVVLFLAGLVSILAAFGGKAGDPFNGLVIGFECLLGSLVLHGFSIIVKAASSYIQKQEDENKEAKE